MQYLLFQKLTKTADFQLLVEKYNCQDLLRKIEILVFHEINDVNLLKIINQHTESIRVGIKERSF